MAYIIRKMEIKKKTEVTIKLAFTKLAKIKVSQEQVPK